jgi:hypothetical protein
MLALPAPLREAIDARGTGLSILVLRLGAMGDIVRTLPAVRLVRSGLPHARIHWAAWEPWTQLLTNHPDVDTVVALPRSEFRALARSLLTWPSLAGATGRIATRLRGLHAGLVLDFHGDLRTALLGDDRRAGAPGIRRSSAKEGNRLFDAPRPTDDRRTPRRRAISGWSPPWDSRSARCRTPGSRSPPGFSAADAIVRSLVGGGPVAESR